MMYEIAKKLKDAGYPQERYDGTHYTPTSVVIRDGERLAVEDCYAPSLAELLAMCDQTNYFTLQHHGPNSWRAQQGVVNPIVAYGKTADEVLANLFVKVAPKEVKHPTLV